MIHIFSSGINNIPLLHVFLQDEIQMHGQIQLHRFGKTPSVVNSNDLVVGWGHKKTASKARAFASQHALPYLAIEDGFLRSIGLGCEGAAPLSLSFDRSGVYYDASMSSDLESLLNDTSWCTEAIRDEARDCMRRLKIYDLSKYNNAPTFTAEDKISLYNKAQVKPCQKLILVVDQTLGDASIELGNASEASFRTMLDTARAQPNAVVVIKTHPDVLTGKKKSCFGKIPDDVCVVSDNFAPLSFLEVFDEVYAVTSQMGFEALMLGKPVHTFGASFYAGWGLTIDHSEVPKRRTTKVALEVLFAALYFKLCRYVNPVSESLISLQEAIDIMAARRIANERNRRHFIAVGFRRWKHEHVKAFAGSTGGTIEFESDIDYGIDVATRDGKEVIIWAGKATDEIVNRCKRRSVPLWRMEDGFLRSVGLGVDYHYPYSLILDDSGIYFDPARESRLTKILSCIKEHPDLPRLLERSEHLIETICKHGLSKYNSASDLDVVAKLQQLPKDRKILLVPGQVDGDASVRRGGGFIQNNEMLLKAVRHSNPDAFIIYKPHPDVTSKNREGAVSPYVLDKCTDLIVTSGSLEDFWPFVDEVHTLTSLSGFEALLRKKHVVTYGIPFYAGWGLTEDHAKGLTGHSVLTIKELIAGVMIIYANYWDWKSQNICRPEDVCLRLICKEQPDVGIWIYICRLAKVVRRVFKGQL